MKIKELEKWCNKNGGYYDSKISECGTLVFIELNTYKGAIFPNYMTKLKRFLSRNKLMMNYMYCSNGNIVFAIIGDIKKEE